MKLFHYFSKRINGKTVRTHRIIMEEILGRPLLTDEHVHHKNGDTHDNRPENLELVDPVKHGKLSPHEKKLSESDIVIIRQLRNEGYTLKRISIIFSVSLSHIGNVCNDQ